MLKKRKNMTKQYPQNIKEAIISAIPNCFTMATVMMNLNMWIYGAWSVENVLRTFPIIYCTAFLLDFFLVGPFVQRVATCYNFVRYMMFLRVGLMAGILTFIAPILESGYIPTLMRYVTAFPRNYVIALLTQAFIAMPFGMYVLGMYRVKKAK